MASKTGELFKFILIIQILFGLFITCTLYFLPTDTKPYVNQLVNPWTQDNAQKEQEKAEQAYHDIRFWSGVPILGTLMIAIDTGNVLVDFLANSILALPEMVSILFGGLFYFIPVSPFIAAIVTASAFAICFIVYLLLLIGFIGGLRTGTVV
jgi:hypothetical protein